MDARRLVGASMSARKRAARRVVTNTTYPLRVLTKHTWWRLRYVAERERYRIGERLRPCPALGLQPASIIAYLHRPNAEGRTCGICGGSGVVPARRSTHQEGR